jgi:hypothetical protein
VAGSVIADKWYLFGGRGADSYCRNSMHVLDLTSLAISPIKTTKNPKKREGHSCVVYNDWLVVFGGCEGGEEETESFNDICIFDVKLKSWAFPQCRGRLPSGREGHAAGMIEHYMMVYGGNSSDLLGDIFILNLKSFTWEELTLQGTSPGHRESMAFVTLRNCLYIFGGNSSPRTQPQDEFNNDLYCISLIFPDTAALPLKSYAVPSQLFTASSVASSVLLATDGPIPPKRLSHSMCALDNDRLITFGGEGRDRILSDVWVYDLNKGHWREIAVSNDIPGRMSHILSANPTRLLVFGGMNSDRDVINDMAILDIEEALSAELTIGKDLALTNSLPRFICTCGHSSSTCEFLRRFPEVSYPKFHFFTRSQVPLSYIEELSAKYTDPAACLFHLSQQLSTTTCSIKSLGTVLLNRRGKVQRLQPPQEELNLAFLPSSEEDDTLEMRAKLLGKYSTDPSQCRSQILMVSGDYVITPDLFLSSCVGSSPLNLLVPCLALSSTVVLVSKSSEYLSIALVTKELYSLPCFSVVFDAQLKPLFPSAEVFSANLNNILQRSHLSMLDLTAVTEGLSVFLYCQGLESTQQDLKFVKSRTSMLEFLTLCYFKAPSAVSFVLQGHPVSHSFFSERCQSTPKHRCKDVEVYECPATSSRLSGVSHPDVAYARLLVYYSNVLIYSRNCALPKLEETGTRHKRPRSEEAVVKVVVVKSKRFISLHTKQLAWGEDLVRLFSAVHSGDYSDCTKA